jgi:hypothetical protein
MHRPRLLLPLCFLAGCAQAITPEAPTATLAAVEHLQPHQCAETTARGVSAAGLSGKEVQSLFYTEQVVDADEGPGLIGYLAWMRVSGQPGYLVVDMNQFCQFRQVYTRDGMQLAGVSAY